MTEDKRTVVISNRIYIKTRSKEELRQLMSSCTYKVDTGFSAQKSLSGVKRSSVEYIKTFKLLPGGVISIPVGRTDLIPEGAEVIDKRILVPKEFPAPKIPLRDGQRPVYEAVNDNCFINALVGWGKTFASLYIAAKLGQKTLVIVHTTMLRDQWISEIHNLFGINAGIIGGGRLDYKDKLIVVGNVQSVVKHINTLSKEFGLIILDEAHHVPATTFTSIVDGMHARYRIGLSGTMQRKDGKHVLFRDFFGSTVHRPEGAETLKPTVSIIKTGIKLPASLGWAQKMNELLYDKDYQKLIADIALVQMYKGHKVLIVADRTNFLESVKELLGETCILITGKIRDLDERNELVEKIITGEVGAIAGSRQIFAEGISVNVLSSIILAQPIGNPGLLEQLIGRIQRLHPDKLHPEVIDINFGSSVEKKQDTMRLAFYVNKGWKVNYVQQD